MESDGKYVRAPVVSDSESSEFDSEEDYGQDDSSAEVGSDGKSRASSSSSCDDDEASYSQGGMSGNHGSTSQTTSNPNPISDGDRLQRMENVLADITKALNVLRAPMTPIKDTDQTWSAPAALAGVSDPCSSSIRWDNIKPFPNGVPANKMWGEWNRYIENFEIAATLNNANDPVRRCQLLFLSVGEEFQGIIRAAKLRPELNDANCYRVFVSNIKSYLQTMTDSAAEHEAFSNMRQETSESAIAFHARLMEKVRLCEYSPADQDRFVRSQLLKGLRNKELVKAARTYGYDTQYIVQAATRDASYQAETAVSESSDVYAVYRGRLESNGRRSQKRSRPGDWNRPTTAKRPREEHSFRRDSRDRVRSNRCPRCNQYSHKNFPCPALRRKCNSCHEFGHYAAVCRNTNIQQLRVMKDESPKRENETANDQV